MRRSTWGVFGFTGLAGFTCIAIACSSAPGPLYPDVTSFCNARAKAECGETANCHTSIDSCTTERAQLCQTAAATAIATGTRQYKADNAPACVDLAKTTFAASAAQVKYKDLATLDATCQSVFLGNVADGQHCSSQFDCSTSGDICDAKASVCVAPKTVAQSATGYCTEPGQVCAAGSYCAPGTGVCTLDATQGQPCGAIPCGPALRCVSGTCQARSQTGGACASNDDCDQSDPNAPLNCDIVDVPFVCSVGVNFAPAETVLCSAFGGSTTPIAADAGVTPPTDSGAQPDTSTTTTDSGHD